VTSKLDTLISAVGGDLKDCLTPVRSRFRFAITTFVNYCLANPTQGNPTTAQNAISATFSGTYPDGLVSPGITIQQATLALVNRNGSGGTVAERWVSVRNWIEARAGLEDEVAMSYEEGGVEDPVDAWFRKIRENGGFVYTVTRVQGKQPTDPDHNAVASESWTLLGKTVRFTYSYDVSSGVAVPTITREVL
jgi:hypothetical protein